MTTFPNNITFTSDQNEAELVRLIPKTKEATYIYTKSLTKKGTEFTTTLEYLKRLLDSRLLLVAK